MSVASLVPGWRWMASFAAFPVAGVVGRIVAGSADELGAAIVGGLATGLVLGAGQWLAGRDEALGPASRWIAATAVGYGVGLGAGGALVNYDTGLGDLAAMGAVTGVALAVTQGGVLHLAGHGHLARRWAAAMPFLMAAGWTITTLSGIDVERHHTIYGSSGALVVTALSGALLARFGALGGGRRLGPRAHHPSER